MPVCRGQGGRARPRHRGQQRLRLRRRDVEPRHAVARADLRRLAPGAVVGEHLRPAGGERVQLQPRGVVELVADAAEAHGAEIGRHHSLHRQRGFRQRDQPGPAGGAGTGDHQRPAAGQGRRRGILRPIRGDGADIGAQQRNDGQRIRLPLAEHGAGAEPRREIRAHRRRVVAAERHLPAAEREQRESREQMRILLAQRQPDHVPAPDALPPQPAGHAPRLRGERGVGDDAAGIHHRDARRIAGRHRRDAADDGGGLARA